GRCYEASTVPFQACDALVDEIATLLRRIPEEEREAQLPPNMSVLERVFPVLAGLRRETGPPAAHDVDAPRDLAFLALRELVGRIAERHRLILFIDDLHWGAIDSKMALGGLLSGADSPAALFILAWRKESGEARLPQWLTENANAFRAEVVTIDLEPLDPPNSKRLADELLRDRPDRSRMDHAARIAGICGGNPFLI